MIKVEQFSISYRPDEDAGTVHLALANGTGADLPIDSPSEAHFMYVLLKSEDEVFFDPQNRLIVSGIDAVGEHKDADA
ncbi:MAG: hypothetical protein MRY78_20880 [Saprospiraceae bacterium]|nr:hypothetical protein [Saprospiraceae bacterium]